MDKDSKKITKIKKEFTSNNIRAYSANIKILHIYFIKNLSEEILFTFVKDGKAALLRRIERAKGVLLLLFHSQK